MKKVSFNIYKFTELAEDSQTRAVKMLADTAVRGDWTRPIVDRYKLYGIGVTVPYNFAAETSLLDDGYVVCERILESVSKGAQLYRIAARYMALFKAAQIADGNYQDDERVTDHYDDLEHDLARLVTAQLSERRITITSPAYVRGLLAKSDRYFYEDGTPYHEKKSA